MDDIGIPQRLYNLSFTDGSTIGPNDGVILKTAGEAAVLLLTGQRLIATSVPTRCYETTDRSIHETRRVAKKTYRPFATQQQHALLCFTINSQYFTVDRPRFLSGHTARNANTSLRSNPWPTQRKSTPDSLIRPHASRSPPAASRQSRLVMSPLGSDSVVRRCPRHVLRQRSQFGISDGSRPWVKKRRATTPSPSRCTG